MTLQLFKWMMALAIMLYLPVLFERVRRIRKTDTRHSAEYIKQRVESIYFDVTHFYNQLGALREEEAGTGLSVDGESCAFSSFGEAREGHKLPETWPDFERLYCSEAWNKAAASTPIARNPWLAFPQLEFLYANKVEVIDNTGDQGTVSLVMHNGDRSMPIPLNIVFEREDWFIDNMTYNWNIRPTTDYFDWRQAMADAY